jgi:hypothetical protein
MELYSKLTNLQLLSDYEEQIIKDISRTFPRC